MLALALVEIRAAHRFSIVGAGWPVARLLAQWAVLAYVFTAVVELSIDDYPVFLLCGLIVWTWFSTGVSAGARSLSERRHLVLQPGLPALVVPLIAVALPLVDVLLALPVLLTVILVTTNDLHASLLLLPVLGAVQLMMVAGFAWAAAALSVYVRDVRNVTEVGLLLLFYLTPVFYDLARVPEAAADVLALNPIGVLADAWRDAAAGRALDWPAVGATGAFAAVVAVSGAALFRRLESGFVDEL